jgi:hypothetical protein
MGATQRINLYRKLAPIFFSGDGLEAARMAIEIADVIKDDREWLAHGVGFQVHDDTLDIMRSDEMRTNERKTTRKTFTRDRIIAAERVIETARICLLRAYVSIEKTLLPPTLRDLY